MKQTKDIEYHKKILKLGVLKLEESKVHREAIVKLMAPLNLSERKEIQREMDKQHDKEVHDFWIKVWTWTWQLTVVVAVFITMWGWLSYASKGKLPFLW